MHLPRYSYQSPIYPTGKHHHHHHRQQTTKSLQRRYKRNSFQKPINGRKLRSVVCSGSLLRWILGLLWVFGMVRIVTRRRGSFSGGGGGSGGFGGRFSGGSEGDGRVREGVSLVAVCMNRGSVVKEGLKSWRRARGVDEVVVVDWSSEGGLGIGVIDDDDDDEGNVVKGKDVRVVRVEGEGKWVLSRAYNLGVNLTRFDKVLRVDCDYKVGEKFVEEHALGEGMFYAGNYDRARDENEQHLNGVMFLWRKDFMRVGGYDERIQTYGWDDEDIYGRLKKAGLVKKDASYDQVEHVKHGNEARAQKSVKFVAVEIDLNALLLEKLPAWSKDSAEVSKYTARRGVEGKDEWILKAKYTPAALKDLVSKEDYEASWGLALGRRLHDTYEVSWDILANMKLGPKEHLLRRMLKRSERFEAEGRTGKIPRLLVCHPVSDLGSRMRSVGSCLSYAKNTARELVVVWEKDGDMNANFEDLFEVTGELAVAGSMSAKWPFEGVEKWDTMWKSFVFSNAVANEGSGADPTKPLVDIKDKHMYHKLNQVIKTNNEGHLLTTWESDRVHMLNDLKPVASVQDVIKKTEQAMKIEKGGTVGVDLGKDEKLLSAFESEIKRSLDFDKTIRIFAAGKASELVHRMKEAYPGRVIGRMEDCKENAVLCEKHTLADIIILSYMGKIWGDDNSVITEVAQRLGGPKARLAGIDFR